MTRSEVLFKKEILKQDMLRKIELDLICSDVSRKKIDRLLEEVEKELEKSMSMGIIPSKISISSRKLREKKKPKPLNTKLEVAKEESYFFNDTYLKHFFIN
jgi:signal recognition particle GTPase